MRPGKNRRQFRWTDAALQGSAPSRTRFKESCTDWEAVEFLQQCDHEMTTGAGEVGLLRGPADGPACLKLRPLRSRPAWSTRPAMPEACTTAVMKATWPSLRERGYPGLLPERVSLRRQGDFSVPRRKCGHSSRRSGTLRGDVILPSCFLQEYLPVGMLTLCERVSRLPEGKEAERHRHSGCSLAGGNGRPLPRPHRNPLQRARTNFFCRQSGGAKSPLGKRATLWRRAARGHRKRVRPCRSDSA